jgi:hypothetical protein
MPYIIGVSSGIFSVARERGPREAIQYAGLSRKAQYCITKGVQFVQIDLENIAEFQEPNLAENMEKIKKMGISFGIHSESIAFGGREIPFLDSSLQYDYERSHKRLELILREAGKLGAKYVLLHSSESPGFLVLSRDLQTTLLVDFWGRPLKELLEENPDLLDWAIRQYFILEIALHRSRLPPNFDDSVELIRREYVEPKLFNKYVEELSEKKQKEKVKYDPETKRKYIERLTSEEMEEIRNEAREKAREESLKQALEMAKEELKNALIKFMEVSEVAYGSERVAIYIVGKFMEMKNDPLWNDIINSNVEYYAKLEKMPKDEWLEKKGIKSLSLDDREFRLFYKLWVPAVSAKYIWGHFSQNKRPSKDPRYADLKKIIKEYGAIFVLETPMVAAEEYSRMPNPLQIHCLVKHIGTEYARVAWDLEHMLAANVNPEVVIDVLPEGEGKFIKVIHAGYPAPLAPAHIPIPMGSEQQLYLYKIYYLLRQKGFGVDTESNYYLVFERGGGEDPIRQSILALRIIVKYLEKNTPPEELPPEFYGVSPEGFLSPLRQRVAIIEHAFDPLKGMLMVPEEEHSLLSRAAIEKGKAEQWKKEELR